jgi:hypothetical protein
VAQRAPEVRLRQPGHQPRLLRLVRGRLPCQWIDITGVPPGDYTLRITLNQPRPDTALPILNERDYSNNIAEVVVVVP